MRDRRSLGQRTLVGATFLVILAACSSAQESATPATTLPSTSTAAETTTTPLVPEAGSSTTPSTAPLQTLDSAVLDDLGNVDGKLVLRTDTGDIVVAAPDGADPLVLGDGAARRNSQPTWSNAGDRIAWSSFSPAESNIEIASADGTLGIETPVDTPPFFLSWSTGDTWLGGLRPINAGIEFLIVESEEASVRAVGSGQPFYFDWRDDSSLVAAVNGRTLVNIPASPDVAASQIDTGDPLGLFQTPAALDDAEIVVAVNRDGSNDVIVLGPDTGETAIAATSGPLATSVNPVDERLAVLVAETAPQSQVIGFQVDAVPELPSGRVSIIDQASGEVTTLDAPRIVATQWSPDGRTLAMLQASQEDLRWLLARSDGTTATTPFVPSNEFASSYLPFADQYNHSSSWWSPDSRALVISGTIGGESGIWVDLVDDEKDAVRVAGGDIALWSPR